MRTTMVLVSLLLLAMTSASAQADPLAEACSMVMEPTEAGRELYEARLVSVLGQSAAQTMDVVLLDPEGKRIDHNERVVPDDMDRTLLLRSPIAASDYSVLTVLLDGSPDTFVSPPSGVTSVTVEPWWKEGRILKLDLVQITELDATKGVRYWKIHVPRRTSTYGPAWPFRRETFAVIACPVSTGVPPMAFVVTRSISDRVWAIVDTCIAVLAIWVMAAWALRGSDRGPGKQKTVVPPQPGRQDEPIRRLLAAMNPISITQDALGFGSMSRLQVFFFTLIVVAALTYVFLRAGYLSEISDNLLILLGITGVSAAATKLVANDRIAREDELTFATDRWLLRHGIVFPPRVARWRDLLITGQEFNIFNFQALVFSTLVGFWILSSAMQNLADLVVPSNLMVLLGLSQALYVGGKAVGAGGGGRKELNNAVSRAIASEAALLALLPIDSAFRKEAQERGYLYSIGETPPKPAVVLPDAANAALTQFQLAVSTVISLATTVFDGRLRVEPLPVDPPDDTFSAKPLVDVQAATTGAAR